MRRGGRSDDTLEEWGRKNSDGGGSEKPDKIGKKSESVVSLTIRIDRD